MMEEIQAEVQTVLNTLGKYETSRNVPESIITTGIVNKTQKGTTLRMLVVLWIVSYLCVPLLTTFVHIQHEAFFAVSVRLFSVCVLPCPFMSS